ncbi:MAG: hypothetical protein QM489_01665 [Candidatus Izemoplasma sp.]
MIKNISNTYKGGRVILDNNGFTKCIFIDCQLVFSGNGPVELNNCSFTNVKWVFSGPAENTLKFLKAMYSGMGQGGKQVVETTFNNIMEK